MGATTATVVGSVAAGAMSYAGSSKQSSAAQDAADLQYSASIYAADKANYQFDRQLERYDAAVSRQMPWFYAGNSALEKLQAGLYGGEFQKFKFNEKKMMKDPGYKFRVSEGVNALRAASAVGGSMGSGNMLAAAENLGQQLATEEYDKAYNRQYGEWTDRYNRLAQLASVGQTQSLAMGSQALGFGQLSQSNSNLISSLIMGGANAQAAGITNSANAWSNGMNNMVSALNSGLGTYLNYSQQQGLLNNALSYSGSGTNSLSGYNLGTGGWDTSGYSLGSSNIGDMAYYLGDL